jgi:hypothetical protein
MYYWQFCFVMGVGQQGMKRISYTQRQRSTS